MGPRASVRTATEADLACKRPIKAQLIRLREYCRIALCCGPGQHDGQAGTQRARGEHDFVSHIPFGGARRNDLSGSFVVKATAEQIQELASAPGFKSSAPIVVIEISWRSLVTLKLRSAMTPVRP